MTNDIEQLEQGILSLLLHIYERHVANGFTEKAAKQEVIKSLVRVLYKVVPKDDPDTLYILLPVISPALVWLESKAKQNQLYNELLIGLLQAYKQEQNKRVE